MNITLAKKEDISRIMEIIAAARKFMRSTGNMHQWPGDYPPKDLLLDDIEKQHLYAIEDESGIHAVFALIFGDDPTYSYIEDGAWLSDDEYATIHRIASDGTFHKVFETAADFAWKKIKHLRVDTHEDNTVMQHVVEKCGFQRCGIIFLENGEPRIAFEKTE